MSHYGHLDSSTIVSTVRLKQSGRLSNRNVVVYFASMGFLQINRDASIMIRLGSDVEISMHLTPIDSVTCTRQKRNRKRAMWDSIFSNLLAISDTPTTTSLVTLKTVIDQLSRQNADPRLSHMRAAKRLVRYLKGTIHIGLTYNESEIVTLPEILKIGSQSWDIVSLMEERLYLGQVKTTRRAELYYWTWVHCFGPCLKKNECGYVASSARWP